MKFKAWSIWKSISLWNYRAEEGRESLRLRKERRKIFKQLQQPQSSIRVVKTFSKQAKARVRRQTGRR